jgi:hypothetical protein
MPPDSEKAQGCSGMPLSGLAQLRRGCSDRRFSFPSFHTNQRTIVVTFGTRQHRTRRIRKYFIPNLSRLHLPRGTRNNTKWLLGEVAIAPNGYWGSNYSAAKGANYAYIELILAARIMQEKSHRLLNRWRVSVSLGQPSRRGKSVSTGISSIGKSMSI